MFINIFNKKNIISKIMNHLVLGIKVIKTTCFILKNKIDD